jgi:hypothetical protein
MPNAACFPDLPKTLTLVAAASTIVAAACAGPDRLLDPMVSEGGTYFASLGGNPSTSGGTASGGTASGGTSASTDYDIKGGANVSHQGHYTGTACIAACHAHGLNVGGTAYLADGTTTVANAQLRIVANSISYSTYSGSQGNFFTTIPSRVDWATAQISIRNANGTLTMPTNSNASGNCNSCHDSSNRIVVP